MRAVLTVVSVVTACAVGAASSAAAGPTVPESVPARLKSAPKPPPEVQVQVDNLSPSAFSGNCPPSIWFKASVRAAKPGLVRYRWFVNVWPNGPDVLPVSQASNPDQAVIFHNGETGAPKRIGLNTSLNLPPPGHQGKVFAHGRAFVQVWWPKIVKSNEVEFLFECRP
jgi:hypothetical protein